MQIDAILANPIVRVGTCAGLIAGGVAISATTAGVLPGLASGVSLATGIPLNVLSSDVHRTLVARLSDPTALLANQDIHRLTIEAIEIVVKAASEELAKRARRSAPGNRPRLIREAASIDQLAGAVRKHWPKFEDLPVLARPLESLDDEKIKGYVSTDSDRIGEQTVLAIDSWVQLLKPISVWGRVTISEEALRFAAEKLFTTLPKAIFELVAADFSKDGKTFAKLHLHLMGEMLLALGTFAEENAARLDKMDVELNAIEELQRRIVDQGDTTVKNLGELSADFSEFIRQWKSEVDRFRRFFESTFQARLDEIHLAVQRNSEVTARIDRRSEQHQQVLRQALEAIKRMEAELIPQYLELLYYVLSRAATNRAPAVRFIADDWAEIAYRDEQGQRLLEFVHFDESGDTDDMNIGQLRQWLSETHEPPIAARMRADEKIYLTLLEYRGVSKRVKGFVPGDWYSPSGGYASRIDECFDVEYRHRDDPLGGSGELATESVRKRVRIIPLPIPDNVQLLCSMLLQEHFNVCTPWARRSLAEVDYLLRCAAASRQSLPWGRVESLLAPYQRGPGRWQSGDRLLDRNNTTYADPNRGEPPRWCDLEAGRIAERPQLSEAWEIVRGDGGFVVLTGAVGTGKTTVCRYLMHRFLRTCKGGHAYYLGVSAHSVFDEELEFFKQRLNTKTLFIVDDENFAPEETERLYQLFLDYKTGGHAKASLVISSKTTYGRTHVLEKGRRIGGLREAIHVRLPNDSTDDVQSLLAQIRNKCGLTSALTDEELAKISGGVLNTALLLARCTQTFRTRADFAGILKTREFRHEIERFIRDSVGADLDAAAFRRDVVPIFVLAAFRLPIPADMNPYVKRLRDAGFLEPYSRNFDEGPYQAADLKLSFFIQEQHAANHLDILDRYFEENPQWIPDACLRLGDWKESRDILIALFEKHQESLLRMISEDEYGLSIGKVAGLLRAVRAVDRSGLAVRLLRQWAIPDREPNRDFFPSIVRRAQRTSELTSFLGVLRDIDRHDKFLPYVVEHLSLDEEDRIMLLFDDSSCRLDEVGSCLRGLWRISSEFALDVYERWRESRECAAKFARLEGSDDRFSLCLRYCDQIRSLDLSDAYDVLETYLPHEHIVDTALLTNENLFPLSAFLASLQRVHPRWASESLTLLWERDPEHVESLFRRENSLDMLTQEFYSFSTVDGRIAVRCAYAVIEHLQRLLQAESRYDTVGATIENTRRNLSGRLADRLADAIDKRRVLATLRAEHGHVDKVGKFLFELSQVSPTAASWFEEHLDYQALLRVAKARRLRDVAVLVRGFLVSASFERQDQLRKRMLDDTHTLRPLLRECWEKTTTGSECAFGLIAMMACPLTKDDIVRLLDLPNEHAIEKAMNSHIHREASVLDVTNGLYAMARFNVAMAKRTLRRYVNEVLERDGRRRLDRGFHLDKNLADNGNLLHIAASVDLRESRRLLRTLDVDKLASICRAESDLGRLTVFLTGVAHTSRAYAREIVRQLSQEGEFERQYERNEKFENLIHFTCALASISRESGRRFAEHVVTTRRMELGTYLRIQTNPALITEWLRTCAKLGDNCPREFCRDTAQLAVELLREQLSPWPHLEVCRALVEIGDIETAQNIAADLVNGGPRITCHQPMGRWIVLVQNAMWLERQLRHPGFCDALTRDMSSRHIREMLGNQSQYLLPAFACFLIRCDKGNSWAHVRDAVLSSEQNVGRAVEAEPNSMAKILATILLRTDVHRLRAVMQSYNWDEVETWELGLARLAFEAIYPADEHAGGPFPAISRSKHWIQKLNEGLDVHAPNLEFGLTLYLARQFSWYRLPAQALEEANDRANDENSAAIAWLLQHAPGRDIPANMDYYLWSLLRNSVLRPTYFPWEQELDKAARKFALGGQYFPDISTLATIGTEEL